MSIIHPTLNLVARPGVLPPQAIFTRASTATRINAVGEIESVAAGLLRHDFDPMTGEYKGWLCEGTRTNLFTRSGDAGHPDWTPEGLAAIAGPTTAPDGTASGFLLTAGAGGTYHSVYQVASAAAATVTVTAWFKAGTRSTSFFQIQAEPAEFTLSGSGSVAANIGGGTASIMPFRDGWYRCRYTTAMPYTNPVIRAGLGNFSAAGTETLYMWGMQAEIGAFATSYIPTIATAATRNADLLTVATSSFAFNAAEGTLFIDVADCGATGGYFAALSSDDNNLVGLFADTSDIYARVKTNDVFVMAADIGNLGTSKKLAIAYKANDCAAVENGGTVVTDASAAPPAVTALHIGSQNGASFINGHVRHVAYFPRRLSNADLQTVTG